MPNQIFRNAIQLFSLILPLKQKDDCVPLFVFLAYIIFFQNVLLLFPPPLERRPCVFCYWTRPIPTKFQLNPPSRLVGVDLARFGDIFIEVN